MRKVLLQMGLSVDGIVAGGPQGTSEAGAPQEDEAVRRLKTYRRSTRPSPRPVFANVYLRMLRRSVPRARTGR
jgi:hypothetical protein